MGVLVFRRETSHTMYSQEWMHVGVVSVTLGCFIDCVVVAEHQRDMHGLTAVMDDSVVLHFALQRGSACQHVVFSSADLSQRGSKPPAGAICILDKTIHHPHCGAQFRGSVQTAPSGIEQLYMYVSVMRALETCSQSQPQGLKGINESVPEAQTTPMFHLTVLFQIWVSAVHCAATLIKRGGRLVCLVSYSIIQPWHLGQ